MVEQETPAGAFRRPAHPGRVEPGDTLASMRYMRLQAILPLVLHGGVPRSALVVGMGTGITAGALLTEPSLERRVVAELLPAVVRAVPLFSRAISVSGPIRTHDHSRGRRQA